MIKGFKVVNGKGEELMIELTRPEESGFIVRSINGLGPVKANINTTELATNDGVVFNSARLSSRNITIDLTYLPYYYDSGVVINSVAESREDEYQRIIKSFTVEDLRQLSYKYFSVKKQITLYFYTDNRTLYIEGYVESNEPDIFSSDSGASISIICPNPYFRELNASEEIYFNSIVPRFEFEWENPLNSRSLIMSERLEISEYEVPYPGDVQTGVVLSIEIYGRLGDMTIYNVTSGEQFSLDVLKIETIIGGQTGSGDRIEISSLPGKKYVKYYAGNSVYNILNAMGKNSNWLSLSTGSNIYAYTIDSESANVNLSLSYPILYEGI